MPGKFQVQKSLVGYSPWGCKDSDTTEQLSMREIICIPFSVIKYRNYESIEFFYFLSKYHQKAFISIENYT